MADYYPLIAQAVNRLERNTTETRGTIYDRARAAMVALRGLTPPLSESDINREQLALERALRKVETESLGSFACSTATIDSGAQFAPRTSRETGGDQAELGNVAEISRYAPRPLSSTVILAGKEDQPRDDLTFARKLAIASPDLSAELEILQKKIRRDRRGALTIWKLVPLTIMGLLIIAVSGAY